MCSVYTIYRSASCALWRRPQIRDSAFVCILPCADVHLVSCVFVRVVPMFVDFSSIFECRMTMSDHDAG